jgi:hypothetical protein
VHRHFLFSVHGQGLPSSRLDVGPLSFFGFWDFYACGDWVLDSTFCEVVEITAGTDSDSELLNPEMQHYGEA